MVKINKETCIGCGTCVSVYPNSFKMEDGIAEFTGKENDCVKEAIEICPTDAIN